MQRDAGAELDLSHRAFEEADVHRPALPFAGDDRGATVGRKRDALQEPGDFHRERVDATFREDAQGLTGLGGGPVDDAPRTDVGAAREHAGRRRIANRCARAEHHTDTPLAGPGGVDEDHGARQVRALAGEVGDDRVGEAGDIE